MTVATETNALLARTGLVAADPDALSSPTFITACASLTPTQRLYAGLFVATLNHHVAMGLSGATPADVSDAMVIKAVGVGLADFRDGLERMAGVVLDRLGRIAFTTPLDFPAVLPIEEDPRDHIPKDLWPAVKAVERVKGVYTKDGSALEQPYWRIKLHDQVKVLEMLHKMLGQTILKRMSAEQDEQDTDRGRVVFEVIEPEALDF